MATTARKTQKPTELPFLRVLDELKGGAVFNDSRRQALKTSAIVEDLLAALFAGVAVDREAFERAVNTIVRRCGFNGNRRQRLWRFSSETFDGILFAALAQHLGHDIDELPRLSPEQVHGVLSLEQRARAAVHEYADLPRTRFRTLADDRELWRAVGHLLREPAVRLM